MGFSISWVAFKGLEKTDVLTRTGFRATGETLAEPLPSTNPPTRQSCSPSASSPRAGRRSSRPTIATPRSRGSATSPSVPPFSPFRSKSMMFSAAASFVDGRKIWRVAHGPDRGVYDLQMSGTPPLEYEPIRRRLFASQVKEGDRPFGADYIYDVPVELAQATTGYRHDEMCAWGSPTYEALESVRFPI